MYLFYALVFPEAQYKRKHMAHAVRVQKTETRDADVYVWRLKKKKQRQQQKSVLAQQRRANNDRKLEISM